MYFTITNDKNECIQLNKINYNSPHNIHLCEYINENNHREFFWFTDKNSILLYINNGTLMVEVFINEFNKIELGKKYLLSNINTFNYLLDLDVNIFSFDNIVLQWASFYGHNEIVKFLLMNGAMNFNTGIIEAFNYACQNDRIEIIKLLIELKPDIYTNDALILACEYGHLDIVKFLLRNGSNIHHYNDQALSSACESGNYMIAKFLLDCKANVNTDNNEALHLACQEGHIEIVKLLLKYGVNIETKNNKALHLASKNGQIKIVKLLLKNGANVSAGNDKALRSAIANGHNEVIRLLLQYGANINVVNNDISLIETLRQNRSETIKILLQNGLDILT